MRGTVNTCVLILNFMLICVYFRDGVAAELSPPIVKTEYGEVWSRVFYLTQMAFSVRPHAR